MALDEQFIVRLITFILQEHPAMFQRSLPVFLLVIVCSMGCKKEEDDPEPTPTPSTPAPEYMVSVNFNFLEGSLPWAFADQLVDEDGAAAQLDRMRFVVSNIRLLDNSGSLIKSFPGVVLKVDRASGNGITQDLGLMGQGAIPRIAFDLGLDDANNALAPSDFNIPPLNDQTLYQSEALGYKFLEITGRWNSNGDLLINSSDEAIQYVPATASMRRPVTLQVDEYNASPGAVIHLRVQMTDFLNGIHFDTAPTAIGAGLPTAQLMNNLQAAIQH